MQRAPDRARFRGRTRAEETAHTTAACARGAHQAIRTPRNSPAASAVRRRSAAPIPRDPLRRHGSEARRDRVLRSASWWRMYGMRPVAALLLMLTISPAFGKSLYWRTFDVTARLDADGRLHVREQQMMVFDGDWNGGERRFNIRPGQSLDVQRIVRVENGADIPLTRGNLSQVDHWDFAANNVIRWRSRLPSDPP